MRAPGVHVGCAETGLSIARFGASTGALPRVSAAACLGRLTCLAGIACLTPSAAGRPLLRGKRDSGIQKLHGKWRGLVAATRFALGFHEVIFDLKPAVHRDEHALHEHASVPSRRQ